jgi:hypothetical protein
MTQTQLAFCKQVTDKIFKLPISLDFQIEANDNIKGLKDYYQKIKNPTCLKKVKTKLDSNSYSNVSIWKKI